MFKDLILYNGKKLELPDLTSFQEKVKYLEENLFSKPEYQKYYGFVYKNKENDKYNSFTKKQSKRIENRWLGVKKVGSDQLNETIKNTLDHLTTYLLSSKDYNSKEQIKNNASKDCFLYNDDGIIFFINKDIEKFLLDNDKMVRYNKCQDLKKNCEKVAKEIEALKELKHKLSSEIKKEYEFMKLSKDKQVINDNLNIISDMTVELQKARKEIKYIEQQIRDLYSDYLYITEWK